jgi:transcriptional antiterminator RfaH
MIDDPLWFCVRAKPKTERTTSQLLRTEAGIEVFCPFVRFERARRSGRLWVTEAMFPGYLFARFSYPAQHRLIRATHGVTQIVSFGGEPAVVPETVINELRASVRDEETVVIEAGVEVGEEVNVVSGPFQGVRAVVTRVMPARERVAILLEVLGMEREVEVAVSSIMPDVTHPMIRAERRKE